MDREGEERSDSGGAERVWVTVAGCGFGLEVMGSFTKGTGWTMEDESGMVVGEGLGVKKE